MNIKRTVWTKAVVFMCLTGVCAAGWFDWGAPRLVVVQGTTSVKDAGERSLAAQLATQAGSWLEALGLRHTLLNDEDITPRALRGARAVILPYNPNPSPMELQAFRSVINSGGILLVFYGMDPDLAALMGVKLSPYRRADDGHPWGGFRFDPNALPGLPDFVSQTSRHLVPVTPDSGNTQIIAHWTDGLGNPLPEPAWIKSPAGFWMTHILQPGDDEKKQQMLLSMLATVIPDVWEQAAKQKSSPQRPFGGYDNLATAHQALGWKDGKAGTARTGREFYLSTVASLAELTRQYALRNSKASPWTLRGIWVDNGDASPKASPADNGFNAIFLRVGTPLALHATGTGISATNLHAWLTCMNLEEATSNQLAQLRDENRLQVSDSGETLPWLCPSHPANRELLAAAASTLSRSGAYAGIQLDYIRYKNIHSCYCTGCRKHFEQALGHTLARWPDEVRTGPHATAFRQWRANQITACVAAARAAAKAANPAVKLSAAVYGATPACFTTVGQDWPAWLDRGLLDFACPMDYTADLNALAALLKLQSELPSASRIFPGIGLASSLSRLSADQAVAQLIQVRRAGFSGYVIFEWNPPVERDVLPYLKLMP